MFFNFKVLVFWGVLNLEKAIKQKEEITVRRLNKADQWLVDEIMKKLVRDYAITIAEAEMSMENSNFYPLLQASPEFVHHEDPTSWVRTIAEQNKMLKQK